MWCVPELTAEFIERMENILRLYEKPYNKKEPMICFDEKTLQLLSNIREPVPIKPGKCKKIDSEYKRCGTANIFVAVEPKKGNHYLYVTKHRKKKDFAKVIYRIAKKYKNADTIHLVIDNLNIHFMKSLTEFYGYEKGKKIWDHFTVHYTPKHGSWLNQAEIEISMLSNQCLGKVRLDSIEGLRNRVGKWCKIMNKDKVTINWLFTTEKAKDKFKY
jgi:hypothetical protein